MITITHYLESDLTVDLPASDDIINNPSRAYIKMRGYVAICILGLEILPAGGAAKIQATLASDESFEEDATTHDDIPSPSSFERHFSGRSSVV